MKAGQGPHWTQPRPRCGNPLPFINVDGHSTLNSYIEYTLGAALVLYPSSRQAILADEIDTVAEEIGPCSDKDLVKGEAKSIGLAFLDHDKNVSPVTVGRASFFIALRKVDPSAEEKAWVITNNNGHFNKSWFYLYQVIERTVFGGSHSG